MFLKQLCWWRVDPLLTMIADISNKSMSLFHHNTILPGIGNYTAEMAWNHVGHTWNMIIKDAVRQMCLENSAHFERDSINLNPAYHV